jgi:hypothetical protein
LGLRVKAKTTVIDDARWRGGSHMDGAEVSPY